MFWSHYILYMNILPISMYLTVDFIRLMHSFFIQWDLSMYNSEKDQPAEVRTTKLNEELGQIEYIFSDKTGTLTQNIMTFKRCCIAGNIYGHIYDEGGIKLPLKKQKSMFGCLLNLVSEFKWADKDFRFYDPKLTEEIKAGNEEVHEFLTAVALNHTVNIEMEDDCIRLVKVQKSSLQVPIGSYRFRLTPAGPSTTRLNPPTKRP